MNWWRHNLTYTVPKHRGPHETNYVLYPAELEQYKAIMLELHACVDKAYDKVRAAHRANMSGHAPTFMAEPHLHALNDLLTLMEANTKHMKSVMQLATEIVKRRKGI